MGLCIVFNDVFVSLRIYKLFFAHTNLIRDNIMIFTIFFCTPAFLKKAHRHSQGNSDAHIKKISPSRFTTAAHCSLPARD